MSKVAKLVFLKMLWFAKTALSYPFLTASRAKVRRIAPNAQQDTMLIMVCAPRALTGAMTVLIALWKAARLVRKLSTSKNKLVFHAK